MRIQLIIRTAIRNPQSAMSRSSELFFQELLLMELGVEAVVADQLVVRAAFGDAPRTVEIRCETMIEVRERITPRRRDRISSSV